MSGTIPVSGNILISREKGSRGDEFYLVTYENRKGKFAYDTLIGYWQHPREVPEKVREEILSLLPYKSGLNDHEKFFLQEIMKS